MDYCPCEAHLHEVIEIEADGSYSDDLIFLFTGEWSFSFASITRCLVTVEVEDGWLNQHPGQVTDQC